MNHLTSILIVIIIIFTACKTTKTVSDKTITNKDIKITERLISLNTDRLSVFDTTDLSRLKRGEIIKNQDKITGIKTEYKLENDNIITSIEVPPIIKEFTVADTTTTITHDRTIIKEVVPSKFGLFWEKFKGFFNNTLLVVVIIIIIALYVLKKIYL